MMEVAPIWEPSSPVTAIDIGLGQFLATGKDKRCVRHNSRGNSSAILVARVYLSPLGYLAPGNVARMIDSRSIVSRLKWSESRMLESNKSAAVATFVLSFVVLGASAPSCLAATWIEFDIAPTLACRQVASDGGLSSQPGESLWEARFRISSLVQHGAEDNLLQFLLRIESPTGPLKVVDYEPKTTLASTLAGNVGIQKHHENSKSLGIIATGALEPVELTGNGSLGTRDVTDVRYELLAPQKLLASSGTVLRGAGVYFKLKPTRQSTLEGGKEYVVVFRAPADWRASTVRVHCEALAVEQGLTPLLNERVTCRREFSVTLFAGGDVEAKRAAESLDEAELQLRKVAQQQRSAIRRQAYPSPLHQFGAMLEIVDARIPSNWLERLLSRPKEVTQLELLRLPEPVRNAANEYVSQAKRVVELGGR